MKTAIQLIRENVAKTNSPQTLRGHFPQNAGAMEVFFPNGSSMLCDEVQTIPRNRSFCVHPDAVRRPATIIKCATAQNVWFVWFDGALHGQFHSEQDAIQAAIA